jgi:thiopeptide-type bacteriocin biosynthesis protein
MEIGVFNKALFRNPLYSTDELIRNFETLDQLKLYIDTKLNDQTFFNAIAYSSPTLIKLFKSKETLKTNDQERLYLSLYKYLIRSSYRATPFGLFSGVGDVEVGDGNLNDVGKFVVKPLIRLDNTIIHVILKKLRGDVLLLSQWEYNVNNTVYLKSETALNYYELVASADDIDYQLAEIEIFPHAAELIQFGSDSHPLKAYTDFLIGKGFEEPETSDFINSLIEEGFLVSELFYSVDKTDYINFLIRLLEKKRKVECNQEINHQLSQYIDSLTGVQSAILGFLENEYDYLELLFRVREYLTSIIDVQVDDKFLLQIDSYHQTETSLTIPLSICQDLKKGIEVLNALSSNHEHKVLDDFKSKLLERYNGEFADLTAVLDPEVGLSFPIGTQNKNTSGYSSLINKKYDDPENVTLTWNKKIHNFWSRKLLESAISTARTIKLGDEDLISFKKANAEMPLTFSMLATLWENDNKTYIELGGFHGATALTYISRFAHCSEHIMALVKDVINKELELTPKGVIQAEVLHLPQARVGNILTRPQLREFEIPFMSSSSGKHILYINDIQLGVVNGEIVLISKKYGKRILPVVSNAHNISIDTNKPLYKFLGELQHQNVRKSLNLDLGIVNDILEFVPRITFENVILSRSSWKIKKYPHLSLGSNKTERLISFKKYLRNHGLPKWVSLIDRDNELPIDTDNFFQLELLYKELLRNQDDSFQLFECLLNDFKPKIEFDGRSYNSQFSINFYSPDSQYFGISDIQTENVVTQKPELSLLDGCLYFCLYCKPELLERILLAFHENILLPLQNRGLLRRWFFIRYNDRNGYHMRLRLFVPKINSEQCFKICMDEIVKLLNNNLIQSYSLNSYKREYDRYQVNDFDLIEEVFFKDSERFLGDLVRDPDRNIRNSALSYICSYLEGCQKTTEQIIHLLDQYLLDFGKEFSGQKKYKVEIDAIFRNERKSIFTNLANSVTDFGIKNSVQDALANCQDHQFPSILFSLIHMSMNRLFISDSRFNEYLCLEIVNRYFKSLRALEKYN